MYLAWREIWFARTRFLMVGGVLALMSILIVIISGLSAGLVNDGVSSLKKMDADIVAFEEGTKSDSAFTRSVVDQSLVQRWRELDGIEDAAPLGLSIVNAKNSDGSPVDLSLFGIVPGSFIDPVPAEGKAIPQLQGNANPTATKHEIVVSSTLKDEGVELGDELTLDRLGTKLKVVGFAEGQRTFGHVDVAFLPIDVWQEIHAGARAGEVVRDNAYQEASVIVARGNVDLDAVSQELGMDARTMQTAFESSPGYLAESMTMSLIQWFLYAIAALVTGAFFLVWTIQRSGDIAVMRAMGATKGFLLRDSLGQAVIILVSSLLIGVVIALAMASGLEKTAMPFAIETGPVSLGTLLLFLFGMAGAAVAVFQVTRTDPLTALGENR
ncbi:FtsX-like permease family protein [Corynebacterium sp. SCR221107]|uniref:ABC transporter permease n=1 Tax=Corynebacterium sp. SCR221107 TaxID=3017361 RepID=UPI0022EC257E|nr:FtsX-like permease family protein [Corynebacterium sp. SCR221107]WBT09608.1 FtsX-like permease family protein [Corynebacterium sp. SCR221107]